MLIFGGVRVHSWKWMVGKLRVHSWKWMVGSWNTTFLFGMAYFQADLLVSGRRGIFLPCQPRGMMVEVGVVKVDVEQVFFCSRLSHLSTQNCLWNKWNYSCMLIYIYMMHMRFISGGMVCNSPFLWYKQVRYAITPVSNILTCQGHLLSENMQKKMDLDVSQNYKIPSSGINIVLHVASIIELHTCFTERKNQHHFKTIGRQGKKSLRDNHGTTSSIWIYFPLNWTVQVPETGRFQQWRLGMCRSDNMIEKQVCQNSQQKKDINACFQEKMWGCGAPYLTTHALTLTKGGKSHRSRPWDHKEACLLDACKAVRSSYMGETLRCFSNSNPFTSRTKESTKNPTHSHEDRIYYIKSHSNLMAPQRTPDLAPSPWKQGLNEIDGLSKPNKGNGTQQGTITIPTKREKENRLKSDFSWDTVDGKKKCVPHGDAYKTL